MTRESRQLEVLLEAARGATPGDLEPFRRFESRLTQLAAASAPAAAPTITAAASTPASLWVKSGLVLSSFAAIAVIGLVLRNVGGSSAGSANDEGAVSQLALETLGSDERVGAHSAERTPRLDLPEPEPSSGELQLEPPAVASASGPRAVDDRPPTAERRPLRSVVRRSAPNRSDQPPRAVVEAPHMESPILREIRLLQPVREALSAGEPKRALATLNALSIHHLGNHATALRAIALCNAGELAAGRRVAKQLGTTGTPSIFKAKVSRSCGEPGEAQ